MHYDEFRGAFHIRWRGYDRQEVRAELARLRQEVEVLRVDRDAALATADDLTRELEEAREELEGRKVVDRAKRLLMKQKRITEEEAYALLRKMAMNKNRKIAEIAQSLITAADLLGDDL